MVGMSIEFTELAAELDRVASTVSLRRGTHLFHAGDPLSGIYIVRKGSVLLLVREGPSIYPPRTLGPGEIVGLPATLTGHYSLTATVVEDSILGFVPGPKVTEMLEVSPRLCMIAMRLMSEEIARVRSALKETPPLEHEE
jgi:CRP/FNR family transcriptional regulator, anaerobic regulatory protein